MKSNPIKIVFCLVVLLLSATGGYADLEFRFDPESADDWTATSDHTITLQVRSDSGSFQLGGFQVDFSYDQTNTGAALTGIDTDSISSQQMSTDFTDATNDGEASVFRAVAVMGGNLGVTVDDTWVSLALIDFTVGTTPDYPINVEVTLYAALDMSFTPTAATWVTSLSFNGGQYRGPCDDCEIDEECYDEGERNPANDCEACDPSTSVLEWATLSDGTGCEDDLYCTVEGECNAGACEGVLRDCDDSVACTVDGCDEEDDECTHAPDDAACSNGQWCDGPEVCNALAGCQAGTAPDCGDSVDCTVDSCDEVADACVNSPDDTLCSNHQWCDGQETCDAVNGCQDGVAVDCPDDGLYCNGDELCDEDADACASTGDPCGLFEECNEETKDCDPVGDDDDTSDDDDDTGDDDDDTGDDDDDTGDDDDDTNDDDDDDDDGNCG